MSDSRDTSWGMGFELFARLFSEATAERGELSDSEVSNLARDARRAVRIWHDTRPADAVVSSPTRPLPARLPTPSAGSTT